ncbi:MAG: hypothetical protein JHC33_00420 [Ignisphaera sp.]|nr:hypothetical protein [Ignisphaera sp.]
MSTNDITGDEIKTKPSSGAYGEGWDRIFGEPSLCPDGNCTNTSCTHHHTKVSITKSNVWFLDRPFDCKDYQYDA